MKASIVPIGNSKGVRIPRALLDLCQIKTEVDLEVKGKTLVIRPIKSHPRAGWAKAFKAMHEQGDDQLVIDDSLDLDIEDWEW